MKTFWTQELRNKAYAVATAVFGVLVVVGVWDQVSSDEATTILQSVLDLADRVAALAVSLGAFIKSRPGKVAVIDVPKAEVEAVLTTSNDLLAGPASPEPDGTKVGENVTIFDGADLAASSGTLSEDDEPGRHVADDAEG